MLNIRAAVETDLAHLNAIDAIVWTPQNTPVDLPKSAQEPYFKLPLDNIWIAELNDVVCGYVRLGQRTLLASNQHVGWLRSLAVHPEMRRQGIASALLDKVDQLAVEKGFRKISLTVLGSNVGAISLYKSKGYRIEGILKDEFSVDHHYLDDVWMAKFFDE